MPEERISWKESNLALIGSDLDKKIKQAAAEGEDNWKTVGVAPGVKVWRIEKFKVVEWPEENYGKFYTGDSYIVLNSWTHPGKDKLHHDLYIWIGAESSQDEYGTAAYKMVEADDYTGGIAVQHREVQGHESYKFKVLFEGSTLTYWEGGVDTGFNHVEPTEEKPNLYKVKGTEKAMSLTQVNLEKGSLNNGDSFILMASTDKVWCWNGESVSFDELSTCCWCFYAFVKMTGFSPCCPWSISFWICRPTPMKRPEPFRLPKCSVPKEPSLFWNKVMMPTIPFGHILARAKLPTPIKTITPWRSLLLFSSRFLETVEMPN
jgi:gelsolin